MGLSEVLELTNNEANNPSASDDELVIGWRPYKGCLYNRPKFVSKRTARHTRKIELLRVSRRRFWFACPKRLLHSELLRGGNYPPEDNQRKDACTLVILISKLPENRPASLINLLAAIDLSSSQHRCIVTQLLKRECGKLRLLHIHLYTYISAEAVKEGPMVGGV